ncbi:MAG: diguanylate cyclase [Defluviitaleaceae bacterium]|nr:diguanylate cyclase [Defluviitaleaceae bacterium]
MDNKHSILIVDDSQIGLMHLENILQEDYILYKASNGVEAVQIARTEKPDIILMDVVMPQMDGYEATIALKEDMATQDIPVIFLTSLDKDDSEEKGLRAGAVDYIGKPYNPVIVKLRVSVQLKIVEQMRTIQDLSMMDSLTRLPNRRFFDMRLKEEWARAEKEKKDFSVILMSIDNLRAYNAVHGYEKGSEKLVAISQMIADSIVLNGNYFAARWADDTFAVLMQDTDASDSHSLAEEIRVAVEKDGEMTISCGVNSDQPAYYSGDIDQFISNADAALYLAKELGQNQVAVHAQMPF